MYGLKNRITRNLTINLVAVMAALLIVMYFFTQQLLHGYILTRLQHDAESLASVIRLNANQQWQLDPGQMSTVYNRVRSGHYYYISVNGQRIRSRSLFDVEFPGVGTDESPAGDYLVDGPGDERWLVWRQQFKKQRDSITVWVAEDIAPIRNELILNTGYMALLIVVMAVLLFYLQQRTLRDAFRIFEWLRQNLASIRHRETEKSGVEIPSEIAPLVTEIEKLVEHLSHRIQRTRHAMGNLAHELKRPLQLLSIQQEGTQNAEQIKTLNEIKHILERELKRSRISGSSKTGARFNLAEELDYMVDVLDKIYPNIDIQIEFENRVEALGLDRDDMLELIGNLLDNACKFARQTARLGIGLNDNLLRLNFEDDGEGLEPEQMKQLNRRGVRLDETVAGHGLGLGICRDILDYYDGSIAFTRSRLGGMRVEVRIPVR